MFTIDDEMEGRRNGEIDKVAANRSMHMLYNYSAGIKPRTRRGVLPDGGALVLFFLLLTPKRSKRGSLLSTASASSPGLAPKPQGYF